MSKGIEDGTFDGMDKLVTIQMSTVGHVGPLPDGLFDDCGALKILAITDRYKTPCSLSMCTCTLYLY